MKTFLLILSLLANSTCSQAQTKINDTLVKQLNNIYTDDQTSRLQLDSIQNKYSADTLEMKVQLTALWRVIHTKDSINQVKVKAILNKYGWLGTDVVGIDGNSALFLVIQHADQTTQEKYLPIMREAVKAGKAKASSLALLEDRLALKQGKKQIYGSQVAWNLIKNEYVVLPLNDPENVDKRRAEVGLQPLAAYLDYWQIKWNIEQYKKDLPLIEAWQQTRAK